MASAKGIVFLVLGILMAGSFIAWGVVRIVDNVNYEIQVEGHIKRAANANTVPLAIQELEIVIDELEDRGWTHGSTAILFHYPQKDVGFWYTNMKAALQELKDLPEDSSTLEKSNALIKLRETLLDGNTVVQPKGISIFPHNATFLWWAILSFVLAVVMFIASVATWDRW